MDRRKKRELREQEIIEQSIGLFSRRGFLGVRMSDIARQTRYSMGTIYSHFESKEDLLVACAHALVKDHLRLFVLVRETSIPPIEQIITLVQGVWIITLHFPELIEIKNLSLMPSIWRRATQGRVNSYDVLHEDLALRIREIALKATAESIDGYDALQGEVLEKQVDYLTHGLWGLSIGLSSITQSAYAESQCGSENKDDEVSEFFTTNYIHLLKGYGWSETEPHAVFERCNALSLQLLEQTRWYAPPRTGEVA